MSQIGRKLVTNPRHYLPLALKVAQQPLAYLFRRCAFFLQGQMDLSPRSRWYNARLVEATGGYYPRDDGVGRTICDLQPWDNVRRDMLILLLRTVLERKVEGDFAEVGVYRGVTAKLIHHYAPERRLHLFDTFEGFTGRGAQAERTHTGHAVDGADFADTSLPRVRRYIGPLNENVFFYQGYFPESIPPGFGDRRFAFVHLDADLYEPILNGLEFFYPRMSPGGMLLVHDYNGWLGARKAADDFFAQKREFPIPMPDKSGSALVVKQ